MQEQSRLKAVKNQLLISSIRAFLKNKKDIKNNKKRGCHFCDTLLYFKIYYFNLNGKYHWSGFINLVLTSPAFGLPAFTNFS